jgi:hypothetical protein
MYSPSKCNSFTVLASGEDVSGKVDDWRALALSFSGAKNAFFGAIYTYKRSFYQDRLGTNIGKVEKRVAFFAGSDVTASIDGRVVAGGSRKTPVLTSLSAVRRQRTPEIFAATFAY